MSNNALVLIPVIFLLLFLSAADGFINSGGLDKKIGLFIFRMLISLVSLEVFNIMVMLHTRYYQNSAVENNLLENTLIMKRIYELMLKTEGGAKDNALEYPNLSEVNNVK